MKKTKSCSILIALAMFIISFFGSEYMAKAATQTSTDLKDMIVTFSGVKEITNIKCSATQSSVLINLNVNFISGKNSTLFYLYSPSAILANPTNDNQCAFYMNRIVASAEKYGVSGRLKSSNYVVSGTDNSTSKEKAKKNVTYKAQPRTQDPTPKEEPKKVTAEEVKKKETKAGSNVTNKNSTSNNTQASPASAQGTSTNSSCSRPGSVTSTGTWKKSGPNLWKYETSSGVAKGWQYLSWSGGNDWFYFDSDGIMQMGWQDLEWSSGENTFYFDEENGNMVTGWQKVQSQRAWYHFNDCGVMQTGWQYLEWNGKKAWYYFDEIDGYMYWDDTTPDGYYVGENGEWDGGDRNIENAVSGEDGEWVATDEEKYYFLTNGENKTPAGWKRIDQIWYFFDEDGSVHNGWLMRDGNYYFYSKNTMLVNSWVDGSDGKKYYLKGDGTMAKGVVKIKDDYYCFDVDEDSDEDDNDEYAFMQKGVVCQY